MLLRSMTALVYISECQLHQKKNKKKNLQYDIGMSNSLPQTPLSKKQIRDRYNSRGNVFLVFQYESVPRFFFSFFFVSCQVLCLTLLLLVSSPSESWAHTLRLFPPLLHSSSQPATVFRSSDCSDGQFSLRYSNPLERITAAPKSNNWSMKNEMRHNEATNRDIETLGSVLDPRVFYWGSS